MCPRRDLFIVIVLVTLVSGNGDRSSYDDKDYSKENATDVLSREKRLVYPSSLSGSASNILLIFGLGTPLQLDQESIIVGAFTKMLYALPVNSTDYTEPGVYYARSSKTRWSIYKVIEAASQVLGYGGKECLLRAICEAADVPFNANHGLFGELVHTFLTPSTTREEVDEYEDQDYHAAERHGRTSGKHCSSLYSDCKTSILEMFSRISH